MLHDRFVFEDTARYQAYYVRPHNAYDSPFPKDVWPFQGQNHIMPPMVKVWVRVMVPAVLGSSIERA